jgi:crossover junction endodeoxyribonuclease RuvC
MRGILGIDPGLTGALVFLDEKGKIVQKRVMPTVSNILDTGELARILDEMKSRIIYCYLESVHAFPGQGVSSCFKFGRTFGVCEGILAGVNIPYTLVTPQNWQKVMHQGIEKSLDSKERGRLAVSRLFPGVDLKATNKCKKSHGGMVDALLILTSSCD